MGVVQESEPCARAQTIEGAKSRKFAPVKISHYKVYVLVHKLHKADNITSYTVCSLIIDFLIAAPIKSPKAAFIDFFTIAIK